MSEIARPAEVAAQESLPESGAPRTVEAAVFLDLENLFKPFRKSIVRPEGLPEKYHASHGKAVAAARRAAEEMTFLPFTDVHHLGRKVAAALIAWFTAHGYTVSENYGRTYGLIDDHGVSTSWEVFVEANWVHVANRRAKDRADRALLHDVAMMAGSGVEWVFVGSSDKNRVLLESSSILTNHPAVGLAVILANRRAAVDQSLLTEPAFARVDERYYLWSMYREGVVARLYAGPDGQKRAGARRDKAAQAGATETVESLIDLDDELARAQVRPILESADTLEQVQQLGSRLSAAAWALSDGRNRIRLTRIIGEEFHRRLITVDIEDAP